ncbi:MAG: tRNA dihydrouridine synthase [Verrucomicrobiales bacterium]
MPEAKTLDSLLASPQPILALAPMQDVTDLPFWSLMARYGGADLYYTEYFRVHGTSNLDKHILKSITHNPTGKPAIAQMIGNDVPALVRSARELQRHPIAAVDLNLGCPAPIVYRKCAGGGLLRDLPLVDSILGALRDAIPGRFTVKTRIGFDTPEPFEGLLKLFNKHAIDLVTVHARTVLEMYRSAVHYEYIAAAVAELKCPVLANGNAYSASNSVEILAKTRARGLMIGRGAIRNPWLFHQIRQQLRGETLFIPTGQDVLLYIRDLFETVKPDEINESAHVQKMKKYMNYLGLGIDPAGEFLHRIRRVRTADDFFLVCEEFLKHDQPMPLEPFPIQLKEHDVMAGEHKG